MFCTKCKSEYRPGFDRCAACDLPLVNSLPPPPPRPSSFGPGAGHLLDLHRFTRFIILGGLVALGFGSLKFLLNLPLSYKSSNGSYDIFRQMDMSDANLVRASKREEATTWLIGGGIVTFLGFAVSASTADNKDSQAGFRGQGGGQNIANSRFAIKSWDEKPFGEGQDLPKLTRAAVTKTFTGDIVGEGHVEYLTMYRMDGSATFVGLERVVGRLAGKAGSFVLQRTGALADGVAKESYFVISGSGTAELRSLRGEGESAVGRGTEHPLTLTYELDEFGAPR